MWEKHLTATRNVNINIIYGIPQSSDGLTGR